MSLELQLADALVAALSDQHDTFSLSFAAERTYTPLAPRSELGGVKISVAPGPLSIETRNRAQDSHEYEIQIGIQQRVRVSEDGEFQNDEIDPLMGLSEEVCDFVRRRQLVAGVSFVRARRLVTYSHEMLLKHGLFTSVLSATYRTLR